MKDVSFFKSLFGQVGRSKHESEPLSGMQLSVIGYLIERQKHGDALRDDIEHEYGLRRATADELLAGMEQHGLVARVEVDDGLERIALQQRGYDLYQQAMNQIWNLDLDPVQGPDGDALSAFCDELRESAGSAC